MQGWGTQAIQKQKIMRHLKVRLAVTCRQASGTKGLLAAPLPTGLGWSLGLGWPDSSGEVLGVGGPPATVGWLGQPQLLLQGGPEGWCWLWAWLGCDWAEDCQRRTAQFPPLPHGTSRNQPDASPQATSGSGCPHSIPGLSALCTVQSWQGQEAAPDPAAQRSPMSILFLTSW